MRFAQFRYSANMKFKTVAECEKRIAKARQSIKETEWLLTRPTSESFVCNKREMRMRISKLNAKIWFLNARIDYLKECAEIDKNK